jgi:RimJ/RimL family protein N-acetyltransferase
MSDIVLQTERLRLELQHPAEVMRWIDSLDEATRTEVSPAYIERLQAADGPDPWTCMFSMVDQETNAVIGSCAFKGPPDAKGIVEIAYGIEPDHQGRGYATEGAMALVEFCRSRDDVHVVRAHTISVDGASARVLQKTGFQFVGEVIDPEDGLVSRWELSLRN